VNPRDAWSVHALAHAHEMEAAALLWRLALFGADVTERAGRPADDIEPLLESDPVYIFNDWHAVMAFGLAGRHERNQRLLDSNRRRGAAPDRRERALTR
jgi:hypothetical protein